MLLDLNLGGQSSDMEFASLILSYPPFQWTSLGDAFDHKHNLKVPLRTGPGTFEDVYFENLSRTDAGVTRDLECYRLLGHPRKGDLFWKI